VEEGGDRKKNEMFPRSQLFRRAWLFAMVVGVPVAATLALDSAAGAVPATKARFFDAPSQAAEFIGYNRSIVLTAAQQKVRDKALSAIPAACCSKFSAAPCCCPSTLAKSVWGLTNIFTARARAPPAEVQAAARQWLKFVNGRGFTGDVCDSPGGCGKSFSNDGCGGMDERNLLAAR
jgi:hypothetical protein